MTSCARYADLDFVERYVLGQMDEAEQAAFEAHYFECPDCFAAVQALQTAQTALRETPQAAQTGVAQPGAAQASAAVTSTMTSGRVVEFNAAMRAKNADAAVNLSMRSRRQTVSGAAWIGLAAAAALAGILVWAPWRTKTAVPTQPTTTIAQGGPQGTGTGTGTASPTPPSPHPENPSFGQPPSGGATSQPSGTGAAGTTGATKTPATPGLTTRPAISLDALALIAPPPYVPLTTRGNEGSQSDAFAAAMAKYAAKDYRGAVDGLKPIVESQPDALPAQFFLGISYLALNEPASASAVLNRVASSNVAPFADEAHFYLAKAALGAHDLDRAERELSLAIERQAGPPNEASKLQTAIRVYRREHNQD